MTHEAETTALSSEEIRGIISSLSNDVYKAFRSEMPFHFDHYHLHPETLVAAISDAASDLNRAASYHSETGPSLPRVAGYIGWWVAVARPIQFSKDARIKDNYNPIVAKDFLCINAIFAVYCIRALMGKSLMPGKLLNDLRYALHFRPRLDGEGIAMLISNCLDA